MPIYRRTVHALALVSLFAMLGAAWAPAAGAADNPLRPPSRPAAPSRSRRRAAPPAHF